MSTRDELEVLIKDSYYGDEITRGDRLNAANIAYDIIAAGWRPPMRVIETVEELEALPGKTVIEDGDGDPWIKAEAPLMDSWMYAGLEYSSENMFWGIRCPFRVVWEPEQ